MLCLVYWDGRGQDVKRRTRFDLTVKSALEACDEIHLEAFGVEEHLRVD